ncbi:sugar kinase [Sphaerisporangium krabiense]|uniref:sugar kinase n=1 Tax=Sphaerisporangium krabiense TaxID=763782 RepID=UPI0019505D87|nr:sugar kinase [Sphaerisporangium krabiense]GII64034.1 sugar kinase [Sphaerisporangium krabiense]
MPDVLTLGEAMACLRADGQVKLGGTARISVAGAEANVAIGLSRLGHDAAFVGAVGPDQFGELVRRTLRAEGVGVQALRSDPAPTGIVVFEQRVAGVTRVDYHRHGSAGGRLAVSDVEDAFAALTAPPRILHVTGVTPALGEGPALAVRAAVRLARAAGARVCLDVNHRGRLWSEDRARRVLTGLAAEADLVIASEDELALVSAGDDEPCRVRSLLAGTATEVVVKRGAAGATAYTADGELSRPARPVTAVDTIGAGDAFVAGYLSGLLDGLPPAERLARAITTGAFAVAGHGDWEGLPTRAELPMLDLPDGTAVR